MKISVITVCYNAERFLARQLDSVACQSWPDVEQIVIDGGSTDRTLHIVRGGAERNPNLRWSSGPDMGISDAMNKGLSQATGDVVAFLHADDFYPDRDILAQVAKAFNDQHEAAWVTGALRHVDNSGIEVRTLPVRHWSYARLVRGNIIYHPATFVKRTVLEEVGGFDTSLQFAMDYDLWLRLGARTPPFLVPRVLACFRIHEGSLSVRRVDDAFREEFAVRCRYLRGKPLQRFMHRIYYGLKFFPNRLSVRK